MADPRPCDPVLLVIALFSRHSASLEWAGERLEEVFGPSALTSASYVFNQTAYYEPTMGKDLIKRFVACERLVPAESLAEIKLRTNALEQEMAESGQYPEPRPLNLDPGILSLGKFMLATTKDQAHRIYLGSGIYGEATLRFEGGTFKPWPWTYADYRQATVIGFLNEAREFYRPRLARYKADL